MRTATSRSVLVIALMLLASCDRSNREQPAKPQVDNRVGPTSGGKPGTGTVELTPGECNDLGGTIKYDRLCTDYHLTCSVPNTSGGTNSSCIDEMDPE